MDQATTFSSIGKFEARKLIAEFDALVIAQYGVNMTDAGITRHEALTAIAAEGSVAKAVGAMGVSKRLAA